MKLLEGKKIAERILANIKKKIKSEGAKVSLAVVLIGENKASEIYVNLKKKSARKIGINFYLYKFKKNTSEETIVRKIKELNANNKINGIIVQLPLPENYNTQKIINAISAQKDADGFSAQGGSASGGHPMPVFPHAILLLIESSKQKLQNKQAVVLANSQKFGSVMTKILKQKKIKANYILAENIKRNIKKIKNADVFISAVGKPSLITANMLKKGVIVIDGGITKKGKKVLGDVDFVSVKNKASYITPVPGGVGPVTIACLLENVYFLAKQKSR